MMTLDILPNGDVGHDEWKKRDIFDTHEKIQEGRQRVVLKFGGTVCGRLPSEVADICLYASFHANVGLLMSDSA